MKDYFKDYKGWIGFLNGRAQRKVCHETYAHDHGGMVAVYYHGTLLVTIDTTGYKLCTNGWRSYTTKKRLNQLTPPGVQVFQKDWVWFVSDYTGEVALFKDKIKVDNLGRFIQ